MIKLTALVSLLTFSTLSSAIELDSYIINGSEVSASEFPDTASLFVDGQLICGATIIDEYHILTAAHCVAKLNGSVNPLNYDVVSQLERVSDYPYSVQDIVKVSDIYIHSEFKNTSGSLWQNDIAILKLNNAIYTQSTAQLAEDESYRLDSSSFTSVGHGQTENSETYSDELLETALSYISHEQCQSELGGAGSSLTDKQLCTGGMINEETNLRNSTCLGDSGGPLYWFDGTQNVQVGIVSFGPDTCGSPQTELSAVYTEIADYQGWIKSVLSGDIQGEKIEGTSEIESHEESDLSTQSSGGGLSIFGVFLLGLLRMKRVIKNEAER
ncbi:serine protease [Vibrio sp.]|nr:serine protease [Vibrio sp.]